MSRTVHILNGPNINMTGQRDAGLYGSTGYTDLCNTLIAEAASLGLEAVIRQTNSQGELITWVQQLARHPEPLIINAGGYTHTSIALMDALALCQAPVVEVHMSNVHAREEYRRHSFVSQVARGVIAGFGAESYSLALAWVARQPSPPEVHHA